MQLIFWIPNLNVPILQQNNAESEDIKMKKGIDEDEKFIFKT